MTDTVWAPWRLEFIEGKLEKEDGCIFCNRFRIEESEFLKYLVLWRGTDTLVMMNRYPYTNAHLLVVADVHTGNIAQLPPLIMSRLSLTVQVAANALSKALGMQGMNIGMNHGVCAGAGIAEHLHWHIVPRWSGDNNFMPVISDTRVMPQYLEETWHVLRPHFQNLEIPVING